MSSLLGSAESLDFSDDSEGILIHKRMLSHTVVKHDFCNHLMSEKTLDVSFLPLCSFPDTEQKKDGIQRVLGRKDRLNGNNCWFCVRLVRCAPIDLLEFLSDW